MGRNALVPAALVLAAVGAVGALALASGTGTGAPPEAVPALVADVRRLTAAVARARALSESTTMLRAAGASVGLGVGLVGGSVVALSYFRRRL